MSAIAGVGAVTLLALFGTTCAADAAEMRVFSTGAPVQAVRAIAADFAAASGHQMTFTVGQPASMQQRLAAGEPADVVILPSRVIAKLSRAGTLRGDSAVDIARVGIGVVVRAGAAQPDISSAAAIRKLLLDAHSIVYPDPRSGGGSAGRAIARMIDRMGIADTIKQKLTLDSAIGGGVALVANGKVEVGLFNVSEILPIQGTTMVGPLPSELQSYIVFGAAIPASNAAPQPAAAFIKKLADPTARKAWQDAGLEPVAPTP